jgi:hypothetical protein
MRPTGRPELLEKRRNRAIDLLHTGYSNREVALQLGVSVRSVRRWHSAYRRNGRRALKTRPNLGRPYSNSLRSLPPPPCGRRITTWHQLFRMNLVCLSDWVTATDLCLHGRCSLAHIQEVLGWGPLSPRFVAWFQESQSSARRRFGRYRGAGAYYAKWRESLTFMQKLLLLRRRRFLDLKTAPHTVDRHRHPGLTRASGAGTPSLVEDAQVVSRQLLAQELEGLLRPCPGASRDE